MSVIWRKVWFDLWHSKGRTMLAVASIAAGLFAVGGIFGLVDQLLESMDAAHRDARPSHISIILRDYVDRDAVAELAQTPGVAGIEPVNQITVRYKLQPGDPWELATLVERPDYLRQTYDTVSLRAGNWPSGNTLGVERLSSEHWDIPIGSRVIFEAGGEEREFEIGSVIRHPFVQPPPFGGQAHFFADAQALAAFGVPEGRFGQLLVRSAAGGRELDGPPDLSGGQDGSGYSLARAQQLGGELRSRLAKLGYGVVVTLYQDPEKHWGRPFVEGVNLVLQIMAVVSLLISVILVLNTFTALITQQTDQIGVIKAVGGRSGTVARIYLAGALILGLLALVVALPAGAGFAHGMARWYLHLFNIDTVPFQLSRPAVILQAAGAILAPLLAAAVPVARGAAISVREAIASYGLGADFGTGRFDRLVERFGARLLPPAYAAALANLFRRKGRLALTLLVLALAGVMFLVVMSLITSIDLTVDNDMARRGYDIRIGFTANQDAARVVELARSNDQVEEAETWFSRNATILRGEERLQDSAGLGGQLLGVPIETSMYRPIITRGRWLIPGDERAIIISEETANRNQIAVGDRVTLDLGELGAAQWRVAGLYRVVYGGGFVVEPIYAPLEGVRQATRQEGAATQVLVRTASGTLDAAQHVADDLKTHFEEAGIKIDFYTTTVKLEEREYADNQFGTVIQMLLWLALLVANVGGIGLAGALGISVVERTREIGVMRAIGARSRTLMGLFIMEGVLQGLLSWLVAVPISYVLAQPAARLLGQTMLEVDLDFAYNWEAVLLWLGAVLAIAVVAALTPARNAARVSVREALAYS